MYIDPNTPIISESLDTDGDSIEEKILWSSLRMELESQNANEALMYLRHMLSCEKVSESIVPGYTRNKYKIHQNISSFDSKYNVTTKENIGFMCSALMEDSIQKLTIDECLKIATDEVTLSADAKNILAEFQAIGEEQIFVARWHHFHQNIWVEPDFIQVMVNTESGKVFGVQKIWHEVDFEFKER